MSVKASNWAWQDSPRTIAGNTFTVLHALADIADDDGLCIFAAREKRMQEALAWKARVSVRTFQRAIRELEETGLLVTTKTGRENTYKLDLIATGAINTRQSDVFITSPEIGDNLSTPVTSGGSDTPTVADVKNVFNKRDFNPSSVKGLTTEAIALRADDELNSHPRLGPSARLRRAKARKLLDVDALYGRVGVIFDDLPAGQRNGIIYLIAMRIIGKAANSGTVPFDATQYVAASIEREPEVWRKVAFQLDSRTA